MTAGRDVEWSPEPGIEAERAPGGRCRRPGR